MVSLAKSISKGLKKNKSRFWLEESIQMLSYGLHWPPQAHMNMHTSTEGVVARIPPILQNQGSGSAVVQAGTDTGTKMCTYLLSEGSRPRACGCRLPRTTAGPWRLALEPARARWSSWLRCSGTEVRTADTTWPVMDSAGPLGRELPRAR